MALIGSALVVAVLRSICVPVGSFREALDQVELGMPADRVREILGSPNLICTDPTVDHIAIADSDTTALRARLASETVERWVYSERRPREPIPSSAEPTCRAPFGATELGFDRNTGLLWRVDEVGSAGVEAAAPPPGRQGASFRSQS